MRGGFVFLVAACGGEGGPPPPAIEVIEPALAIAHHDGADNPRDEVIVAFEGALGPPVAGTYRLDDCGTAAGGSFVVAQSVFHHAGDGMTYINDLGAAGSMAEGQAWSAGHAVLVLPAEALDAGQLVVCTPEGARIVRMEVWEYTHFDLPPSPGTNASPLAIAASGDGVWTNEEFHLQLKGVVPDRVVVEDLPQADGPGIFAQTVFGDTPTHIATLGESIVAADGAIWMTESGTAPYDGTNPNHARIIKYVPVAGAGSMRVYNIPGDDNGVIGLGWDARRARIWFTQGRRSVLVGLDRVVALPARLTSFDPDRFPPDPTFAFTPTEACVVPGGEVVGACSTTSTRACLTDHDCVLADQVCPPGVVDDRACFHEYPLPDDVELPGQLLVHSDGSIWYAAYWGGNHIGRLDPDRGILTTFPLSQPDAMAACDYDSCSCFFDPPPEPCPANCCQYQLLGWGPWSLVQSDEVVRFSGQTSLQIGELDANAYGDPRCMALEDGENPCVREWAVPGLDPATDLVHSITGTYDSTGHDLWVTTSPMPVDGAERDPAHPASLGVLDVATGRVLMFPPLSRYAVSDADGFVAFGGAGITAGPGTAGPGTGGQDSMWFADYFRHRLGRLECRYCTDF